MFPLAKQKYIGKLSPQPPLMYDYFAAARALAKTQQEWHEVTTTNSAVCCDGKQTNGRGLKTSVWTGHRPQQQIPEEPDCYSGVGLKGVVLVRGPACKILAQPWPLDSRAKPEDRMAVVGIIIVLPR